MVKNGLNPVTEQMARIDPETHPIFKRLFGEAGFAKVDESTIDAFLEIHGLKMAIFADDPNERKTTLDIGVIAPDSRTSKVRRPLFKRIWSPGWSSRAMPL